MIAPQTRPPRGAPPEVESKSGIWYNCAMQKQIINRLGVAHIRDTVKTFSEGVITLQQALMELGIGKTRLYELRTSFLAAKARGESDIWMPGVSGGNHMQEWPEEAQSFLRRVLGTGSIGDRYSYSFAASELGRKFGFLVDRGQVRHWALDHGIKNFRDKPLVTPQVRRWQRANIGELWQRDATPDYFFGREYPQLHLIDMLDDCSRLQVGCSLYNHERIDSYLHLFYRAFMRYELPLQIYVDKASFFCKDDGSDTKLAKRLRFYGITFMCANTPAAKGKIERVHQVWQDRLPRHFKQEGFSVDTPLEIVNQRIDSLVDYRNNFEVHREIRMTPRTAWDKALNEGRSKIRPIPEDGWWELVWSQWSGVVIGPGGKAVVDNLWCPTCCPNGTRGWVCRHIDGTLSIVLNKPEHGVRPRVVFSNNPRVRII